jgi:RNA polymerase sigma factor (TIGR02999 family)
MSAVQPATEHSSDEMFTQVYGRLKAMASRRLTGVRGATLDTTALVHELYLRINAEGELKFGHAAQFFCYAARAMRHLLIDRAHARLTRRAGGDWQRVTLSDAKEPIVLENAEQLIDLDAVLRRLARIDARAAEVVELRYFAGLTAEQAAEALSISKPTCDRDWRFAIVFMRAKMEGTEQEQS